MRRLRPQCRLLRLGVRAGQCPRADRAGRREGAGDRHRHAGADHRLGRSQHRHLVRRRLGRRGARGGRRAAASCSAGTSRPTAAPRRRCTPRSAASCRWKAARCSDVPFGSWSSRPRCRWTQPASPPTTSPSSCPTRPTSASSPASCERLGIGLDRASIVLDRTGNTSAASIPLALADALDRGRICQGDLVLFVGFGAGMTAASAVVRWSAPVPAPPVGDAS